MKSRALSETPPQSYRVSLIRHPIQVNTSCLNPSQPGAHRKTRENKYTSCGENKNWWSANCL